MVALILIAGLGSGILSIMKLVNALNNLAKKIGRDFGIIFQFLFMMLVCSVMSSLCSLMAWYMPHEQSDTFNRTAQSFLEVANIVYGWRWPMITIAIINWSICIAIIVGVYIAIRKHTSQAE